MDAIAQECPSVWALIRVPLIQQVPTWLLSGLAADFGVLNTWVTYAILTFWPAALPMVIFRRSRLSRVDVAYLRWGFPCIVLVYLCFGDWIYTAMQDRLQGF